MTPENETCKQCGKCCEHLGPGWFRQSNHPLIKRVAGLLSILEGAAGQYLPDGPEELGCCAMYDTETHECLIHKYLGFDAKPEICQAYPEEPPCMRVTQPHIEPSP